MRKINYGFGKMAWGIILLFDWSMQLKKERNH
jgi:hypothetical protein